MAKTLVLLSDSTGDLGERFLQAMTTQFPPEAFSLRVFSFITSEEELRKVLKQVWELEQPILFHTTVQPELKRKITQFAERNGLPAFDLTGGALAFLEAVTGVRSTPTHRSMHPLDEDYEQRIRALDFAIEHDDGLNTENLEKADIVLLGVSRTSKTPTSIYLANKGYRVANVPLVKGLPLPERLRRRPRLRMVGLMIDAEKLALIRARRANEDRIPGDSYTDPRAIQAEIDWAHSVMLELDVPIVDVTHHAVEETAARILKALRLR